MKLNNEQKHVVSSVIRAAEVNIMLQTGMDMKLGVEQKLRAMKDDIYVMVGIVAKALGMTMDDYFEGKHRRFADLKCLACVFIKMHYPKTPMKQIAASMGLTDHTSVIYYQDRAAHYLQTNEAVFVEKYETVLKAVAKWVGRKTMKYEV